MTGKPLNDFQRGILMKLLQIQKLTNHDIAFVLDCDERTVRRRRHEFTATGNLAKKRDVGKNAEKLKPEYLEKLLEWLAAHEDVALLEDCQMFLQKQFDLHISIPTISRQLKKASGGFRPNDKARRFKMQRDANGRPLNLGLNLQGETTPQDDGGQGPHEEARFDTMVGTQRQVS